MIALEVQYLSRQFWRAAQLSEFATFEAPLEAFGSLCSVLGRSRAASETFAFLGLKLTRGIDRRCLGQLEHEYTASHSMSPSGIQRVLHARVSVLDGEPHDGSLKLTA
jgi:hypothetical protein